MTGDHRFFATAPKGLEGLLADELRDLQATAVKETRAGVHFAGELATAYRACLWSRLANRILLPLAQFPAADVEALYQGVRGINWADHLDADDTLAVDFVSAASAISHSRFGAQKVKDAVVDQFRDACGRRPGVDTQRPRLRINVHLHSDQATVSLDLSGDSLHRRGYREAGGRAPLKENLAAAILLRARWPEIASGGRALVDPMCGSGTLLTEAALMAADIAPGLLRDYFGFLGWRQHQPAVWATLCQEAHGRRKDLSGLPLLLGCDHDGEAIAAARDNVERAGLAGHIELRQCELERCRPPAHARPGLLIANPPYGQRLGAEDDLQALYTRLGALARQHFNGWRAAVFTGNPELGHALGLRALRQHALYNGPLPCKLLHFEISPEHHRTGQPDALPAAARGPGAEMLVNRLKKNLRTLGRWADREAVCCYRLYDADIPEYALAVDVYHSEGTWVVLQEYEAPRSVEPRAARRRLKEALGVVAEVLEVPKERVVLKVRRRQRGPAQYEKLGTEGNFHEVTEGAARLWVNFTDYLDTGLFLDHRITRRWVGELAAGRDFLNLFAYTGAATVHAALGGARSTTTVDLSRTYLDWARRNMELNGLAGPAHRLLQQDCLRWLASDADSRRYGLIFLDPPTFSRSKRMSGTLDIQRDHVTLIRQCTQRLTADGDLIFSTNLRSFRLDEQGLAGLRVEDVTAKTLPRDFQRNPRIHRCWRIRLA